MLPCPFMLGNVSLRKCANTMLLMKYSIASHYLKYILSRKHLSTCDIIINGYQLHIGTYLVAYILTLNNYPLLSMDNIKTMATYIILINPRQVEVGRLRLNPNITTPLKINSLLTGIGYIIAIKFSIAPMSHLLATSPSSKSRFLKPYS